MKKVKKFLELLIISFKIVEKSVSLIIFSDNFISCSIFLALKTILTPSPTNFLYFFVFLNALNSSYTPDNVIFILSSVFLVS